VSERRSSSHRPSAVWSACANVNDECNIMLGLPVPFARLMMGNPAPAVRFFR
jgi:hypothetical protein